MVVTIDLICCEEKTTFTMDVAEADMALLNRMSEEAYKASSSACHPRMDVEIG